MFRQDKLTIARIKEVTGGSNIKKVGNNTYQYLDKEGNSKIRLWETDIVTICPDTRIILTSGGFKTNLTKDRLNVFLSALKSHIYQTKRNWYYVDPDKKESLFYDGMVIDLAGYPFEPKNSIDREIVALRKQLNDYMDGLDAWLDKYYAEPDTHGRKEFDFKKAEKNMQGDCWGCLMVDAVTGKPAFGNDHLKDHLKEKYYMFSLIKNALIDEGRTNWGLFLMMNYRDIVKRAVKKYLQKRLVL